MDLPASHGQARRPPPTVIQRGAMHTGPLHVAVTRRVPEPGLALLREAGFEVRVNPHDRVLGPDELRAFVAGAAGLLTTLADRVDAAVLEASGARVVANYAVGFNNVDVAEATRRGVAVTNTPDVLTEASADLTWALLLAVARRVVEGDAMMRAGAFHGWAPLLLLGADVHGKTLGIVGAGRIGRAVARRAVGFGMRILYAGRRDQPDLEAQTGARRVPLDALVREADFLTLHCPLTPETRGLLSRDLVASMKPGAFVVNTARGEVVDEDALLDALAAGRLGGVALDVYRGEPDAIDPRWARVDPSRVVLAPHIGSATHETRAAMAVLAATDLRLALTGQRPRHLVNPDAWPSETP